MLDQTDDAQTVAIQELDDDRLPDGDVTIDVEWSSLNYKDGMILRGIGRLVRNFPHVPGVDLAGTVDRSRRRPRSSPATASCSPASASARRGGAATRNARA